MDNGAAKALAEWSKAVAMAKAEAGKKGKFPKPKEDFVAYLTKSAALAKQAEEQRLALIATIKSYQTVLSDVEGACSDYSGLVAKKGSCPQSAPCRLCPTDSAASRIAAIASV